MGSRAGPGSRAGSGAGAGAAGTGAGAGALRGGRREWSPLPSALRGSFLFIGEYFFRELDVGFGALRSRIVHQYRLTVAGGFGETNAAGDDGFEDFGAEEFAE